VRLSVEGDELSLWLEDDDAEVEFFGFGGELLAKEIALPDDSAMGRVARYRLRGDEVMVRALVTSKRGRLWTKAYLTTLDPHADAVGATAAATDEAVSEAR
jgi:hypothetical protein